MDGEDHYAHIKTNTASHHIGEPIGERKQYDAGQFYADGHHGGGAMSDRAMPRHVREVF